RWGGGAKAGPCRTAAALAALAGALAGVLLAARVRATLLADLLAFAGREGDPRRRHDGRRGAAIRFGLDLVAHDMAPVCCNVEGDIRPQRLTAPQRAASTGRRRHACRARRLS